jgi:hypothetical protein
MIEQRSDLLTPEWGWRELRDYVDASLRRLGLPAETRESAQVAGIYKGFIARWGAFGAEQIARYVMDVERGVWMGQPVDASRFTKGADTWFGAIIAGRLIERFENQPQSTGVAS